ncbi:MAG: hypothetical protein LBD48_06405 [Treponema sp.]|jgi:hypothetical protein|nr:hypothetical protein [Treponema sp.]
MKGKLSVVLGVILAGALVIVSCDSFFSSSWGEGSTREYSADNIDLNAGNVDSWVKNAKGNPKLAAELTEKIKRELQNGKLSEKDRAKLQAAGVNLALEASGIGPSMISNASDAINKLSSSDGGANALPDVLKDMQSDFKANNGSKAAGNLAAIVDGSLTKTPGDYKVGEAPQFDANSLYAKDAKASDVGQTVVLLALAVTDGKSMENIKLDELDEQGIAIKDGKAVVTENATPESVTLAAYLNLIAEDKTGKYDKNPVTSNIKSAFNM